MRGAIVRPQIGLDFDDLADTLDAARHVNQVFPEQLLSNLNSVSFIEGARQFLPARVCAGILRRIDGTGVGLA